MMIAILVAIGAAAFTYAQFNDQGSSIIDKIESLLLGGSFNKRDYKFRSRCISGWIYRYNDSTARDSDIT